MNALTKHGSYHAVHPILHFTPPSSSSSSHSTVTQCWNFHYRAQSPSFFLCSTCQTLPKIALRPFVILLLLFFIISPNMHIYHSVHFFRLLIPDPVCPVPINSLISLTFWFDHLSLLVFPCQTPPSLPRQNKFFFLPIPHQISFSFPCSCKLKATQPMPGHPLAA